MTNLVPPFIVEQLTAGRLRGSFDGAALFVDISGFTSITNKLMNQGQHGAEVLAQVMRRVFEPIVHNVYAQGGFVAYFAGDAITALFPDAPERENAPWRAVAAAWQTQRHMAVNAEQGTPYGAFTFSAKIGIAAGETKWGILQEAEQHRAAYYFRGQAVAGCAEAEKHSQPGRIVLSPDVYESLQEQITACPVSDHYELRQLLSATPADQQVVAAPEFDSVAAFLPAGFAHARQNGEFRQVVNLFINVKGEPEHEEIADFIALLFAMQKSYGGMLNRIDFGDKGCHLLMFWGAPSSYENDIERAISFVFDLRAQSALTLRMGLTYRIAHAGYIGSSLQAEYTCYGQGVNLAARLMSAAGWGEIWIDEEVKRRTFACETISLGRQLFKGFAAEQQVYRLENRQSFTQTPILAGPLIGREDELSQLAETLRPLSRGAFGGVTTIVGEPGLGKSYLVNGFLEQLQEPEGIAGLRMPTLLHCICQTDEILRESLNPFRYWLRNYFNLSGTQGDNANKEAFQLVLAELIEATPDREMRAELQRIRSILGALIDLRWPNSLYEQLTPELRFENTLRALKTLIIAESNCRPVLIFLEDAQWLDEDSVTFLGQLTHNVATQPIALLLTSRDVPDRQLSDPDVTGRVLHLQKLVSVDLATFVRRRFGNEPSESLLQFLEQRTAGNPLFVEQMLEHLAANDLLIHENGRVLLTETEDIVIPEDVRALLVARLDRLTPDVRDVVQEAAILGREFEQEILAQMDHRNGSLPDALRQAEREQIWLALDEQRYVFRHALLRDAAYRMQVRSRRHELHRRAAMAFETLYEQDPSRVPRYAETAYHFDMAEIFPAAMENYGLAGAQAAENYHNEDALTYYSRALALAPESTTDAQFDFLLGREALLQLTGRREEQAVDLSLLAEMTADSQNLERQAEVLLRQSANALVIGDYSSAKSYAERAASLAVKMGDMQTEARALHRQSRSLWQEGDFKAAKPLLEQARRLASQENTVSVEAECLYDLGVVQFYSLDHLEAQSYVAKAQQIYATMDDKIGQLRCQNLLGVLANASYQFLEADVAYQRSLELCRNVGWRYGEARVLVQKGNNHFDYGDYDTALHNQEQALSICRDIGNIEDEAISLDTIGMILHYQGKLTEAKMTFESALSLESKIRVQRVRGFILTHLGYLLVELADIEAAEGHLCEALRIREALDEPGGEIDTKGGLAMAKLAKGDDESALAYAIQISRWLDANGTEGIELPVQLYLICFQVFQANAAKAAANMELANQALDRGYALLAKWASNIHDESLRSHYLLEIPYNRALRNAWFEHRQ